MYNMALRHVTEKHANGTRCDDVSCGWNRRMGRSLPFSTINYVVEESHTAVKSTGDDVVFARVQVCYLS